MADMSYKSFMAKEDDVDKKWLLVDAEGQILGRLASEIARRLRGKHKAIYTPYNDTGDFVVVINAEKVKLTGRKMEDKIYYRHTGYVGGIKARSAKQILEGKFPERVVEKAVERMLPRGPLFRQIMTNLRIYKGDGHPHEAQQPEALDVGSLNRKNVGI